MCRICLSRFAFSQWLTLPTTALDLLPKQCVCPPRVGKVMGLSRSSCRAITLHERVVCSLVTLVLDFSSPGVQDLLVQVCFFPPSRPKELFGPGSSLLRDWCAVIFLQPTRLPISRPLCGRSRWRPGPVAHPPNYSFEFAAKTVCLSTAFRESDSQKKAALYFLLHFTLASGVLPTCSFNHFGVWRTWPTCPFKKKEVNVTP